jgi:endoglucanase
MNIKRIALLMAAIMLLGLFAACAPDGEPAASPDIPTPGETETNDPTPGGPEEPDWGGAFTPVTGWEMMAAMGVGINIGNTLDAIGDPGVRQGLESETLWGAERIERWQLEAIAMKGFDSVRIPVTWTNHMDKDTLQIDGEWMDRVQECVDMALEAGLIVVLNTHHEHELYDFMIEDGDFEGAAEWLTAVWGQIAERFKYYPETLIFEPMNEPSPGGSHGQLWYWDRNRFREGIAKLSDLTNRLNRHILEVIRDSGGYNSRRVVALTITQADANLLYQYEHTFDDPYTMVGVFFYPGGEQNQLDNIRSMTEQGVPVILKETMPIEITDEARALEWSETWYPEMGELGVVPMWWNCYGIPPTELFNRLNGRWFRPQVDILFAAYNRTPGPDMSAPEDALMARYFDDSGYNEGNAGEDGHYWFGGVVLRDAMVEFKYLAFEVDTDELMFVVHSGADGYTRIDVPGIRIEGTNWWYMDTEYPMSYHLGPLENMGWWFQIQLICELNTDSGIPRGMLGGRDMLDGLIAAGG